ncbi:cbb3-type cytochrome oxidase subunit 3 [Colwellia sp. 20A7]|jgi:cytochrome c oxidase cbb3-type subunit 4|uniref:cbb3-type cytochrome oxidase subunit 3 n=1 Tax=Colwellia sp. 20A7 TaxID=2689569 RepID=UPI0013583C88|nr:cbb3-type cytochrome c oxidase subunit 3 [Colwellia sp. 20A7]
MDYGTLRGFFALLILALFTIIIIWSYSKKRRGSFDDIANSIFEEDNKTTDDIKLHHDKDSKQETNNNV